MVDSQQSALDRNTRLVTLTVGAANLGLSRVLAACTAPKLRTHCQAQIGRALALVGGLFGRRESRSAAISSELYGEVAAAGAEGANCGDWLPAVV